MNPEQARDLVKQTFRQAFDKNRFLLFIRNLLNQSTLDESKAQPWSHQYVKDAFKDRVSHYERLATYTDPDDEKIDVLIVYLNRESSLERARTSLRNFAADYLNTRGQKEAALIAFVSPTESDWRFSYVKMEYSAVEKEDGKVGVQTELTPARRYSYLVGENESCHTAQSRFLNLLQDTDNNPKLAELEDAFSVEKVTDEFFEQYKQLFLEAKDSLDGVLKHDARIRAEFESKDISTVDFVKKLLGQIVFLYFLQKKGWFGVQRDAAWGAGPKNYLRLLLEDKARIKRDNFFNNILEPLFYEALARERDDNFYSRFNCRIPFLNGGLFEPLNDYDWVHTDILLPDTLFSNNKTNDAGDKGSGILDVFDRYNFTVAEDEPLEKEVAIDPEFLGRVFEKLNAINQKNFDDFREAERSGQSNLIRIFNRKNGVFYTPREIVHFMCQRSLVSYLETELAGKIDKGAIETFINIGDRSADFEARPTQKHEDKRLPLSIRENAPLLDKKLQNIRVCDPAIGSGAFPVGMMHEIVRARLALSSVPGMPKCEPYDLKRHAIQNCLFGVDIDPSAVEIAKLRLWLSLVVDENDLKQIKPLPNLDFKIMQGNSLLDEFEGVKLFDDRLLNLVADKSEAERQAVKQRIADLSAEYISLHQSAKLNPVRKLEITRELEQHRKLFASLTPKSTESGHQAELSDKFSEARQKVEKLNRLHKAFFDVPSGEQKKELRQQLEKLEWEFMEATLKEQKKHDALQHLQKLRRASSKPFFLWKLQFMEVFREKGGFDIVVGNPPYGADLSDNERQYLSEKYPLVPDKESSHYFTCVALSILAEAATKCFIIPNTWLVNRFAKKLRRHFLETCRIDFIGDCSGFAVFDSASVRNSITMFSKVQPPPEHGVRFAVFSSKDGCGESKTVNYDVLLAGLDNWLTFFSTGDTKLALIQKIRANTKPLNSFSVSSQGLIPYDKYRGHDEQTIKNRIWHAGVQKDATYKKELQGKDVDRYKIKWNGNTWISYGKWLAAPRDPKYFRSKRILIREITNPRILAAYAEDEYYNNPSIINVVDFHSVDPFYLLGILNSKLMSFYHIETSPKSKKGLFPKILVNDVRLLPIKISDSESEKEIAELACQVMKQKESKSEQDTSKLETEIDKLVYALYSLTPEEIRIVEGITA